MSDAKASRPFATATIVWLGLLTATALAWILGHASLGHATPNAITSVVILLIAFAKARFVMRYFMELRAAPLVLKLLADVWLAATIGTLLVLYSM